MLMGLGVMPKRYDPFVDQVDIRKVHAHFAGVRDMVAQTVQGMPEHATYVAAELQNMNRP
jgi:tryptophan halogenase